MKLLILGHGRHGKDSVAEILRDLFSIKFVSSSFAAAEIAVYPHLKDLYGYSSIQECFDDRANHRMEWKNLITEYNTPDKSKLCKEILEVNDCYVGMRCGEEYEATKDLFDFIIWVDASKRVPLDPSLGIEYDSTRMILVDNNSTERNLIRTVQKVAREQLGLIR